MEDNGHGNSIIEFQFPKSVSSRRAANSPMSLVRGMREEAVMTQCSFEKLIKLLDKELDLDGQLDILDHLDRCENCREAVFHISRDRDGDLFIYPSRDYQLSVR